MKELWSECENWLNENFKAGLEDLNVPIEDEGINQLEATLGCSLPKNFKNFLRIHNGQKSEAGWIIDGSEFLSSERIAEEWGVWNNLLKCGDFDGTTSNPEVGIKNDWWNPKWIPFTYDGSGNHLCIDLDPTDLGSLGQIITMWHDDGERKVLAKNFREWFQHYVSDLKTGKYAYSSDYEAVVNVRNLGL